MLSNIVDEEEVITQYGKELLTAKLTISGGIAGVVAKSSVAPFTRVTILMQVQSMRPNKYHESSMPNNTSMFSSLTKMVREEGGIKAMFRGNGAAMLHRFPYSAATFGFLEVFKNRLSGSNAPSGVELLLSSTGAAACAVILAYPLDIVKTRLTTQTKTAYYSGIVDCLRKISRDEGYRGLYRGLPNTLLAVVPNIALNLSIYWRIKSTAMAYRDGVLLTPFQTLTAGAVSGFISSSLIFPLDLLRRQMQMEGLHGRPRVYANTGDAVKKIFLTGYRSGSSTSSHRWRIIRGLREFYRGLVPELVKVMPFTACQFMVYELFINKTWPGEHILRRRPSYEKRLIR